MPVEVHDIAIRCNQCGIVESFATDDDAKPGDDWEQQCSRYPDCSGDLATVVEVGD